MSHPSRPHRPEPWVRRDHLFNLPLWTDHLSADPLPAHRGILRAHRFMAKVLAGNVDHDVEWEVGQALLALTEVYPPLPAMDYPDSGPSSTTGCRHLLEEASEHLRLAIETSAYDEEAIRAARAYALLQRSLERVDDLTRRERREQDW